VQIVQIIFIPNPLKGAYFYREKSLLNGFRVQDKTKIFLTTQKYQVAKVVKILE
jgi:hypothetical protein